MRKRKDMLIVLPNLVTGLRMIGTFLLLFTKAFSSAFYVIFSICGITDVCDGFLARRTGTTSEFGAKLDSVATVKFRCFASIHTYLNKMTGLCVFIIPYFIGLPFLTLFCMAVCGIATIASLEELVMHICAKEYDADSKALFVKKQ